LRQDFKEAQESNFLLDTNANNNAIFTALNVLQNDSNLQPMETFLDVAAANRDAAQVGRILFKTVGSRVMRILHDKIDPIPDDEEYKYVREARDKYYNLITNS
jgi:hypothetical protein